MRAKMEEVVELTPGSPEANALQAVLLRLVKYAEQLVVQLQEVRGGGGCGSGGAVLWPSWQFGFVVSLAPLPSTTHYR
jgi:hypothetical protein